MTEPLLIDIYADTRGFGRCRGCNARLEWAEVVKSGKKMPFTSQAVALASRLDPVTQRWIDTIDLTTNHWGSCPNRDQFRKR